MTPETSMDKGINRSLNCMGLMGILTNYGLCFRQVWKVESSHTLYRRKELKLIRKVADRSKALARAFREPDYLQLLRSDPKLRKRLGIKVKDLQHSKKDGAANVITTRHRRNS